MSELATVHTSYILHKGLPIDRPEVTNANSSDPILDVAVPSIPIPLHRTRLESLLNGGKVDVLDKVHDANPGFKRKANLVQSRHHFVLERVDFRLPRVVGRARETFGTLHPLYRAIGLLNLFSKPYVPRAVRFKQTSLLLGSH